MQTKQRSYYIDLIRIFAILAVIAIHTDLGELYLKMPLGSVSYYLCLFISMSLSFSPAVFFMISGALLLEKEEAISVIWKKRILRIFIDTCAVSLLYFILDIKSGSCEADPLFFISQLFSKPWITPFWYLYAYLSFLICLPFLRGMAKAINEKSAVYLFVLVFFLQAVWPLLQKCFLNGYELQADLRWDWLLSMTVVYPLLGYAIHREIGADKKKKILPVLLIADLIWMILQIVLAADANISSGQNMVSDGYRAFCALLHASALFMFFGNLQERGISAKAERLLSEIGGCIFGIYLFHGFFLDRIRIIGDLRYRLFSVFSGAALLIPSVLWILLVFGMTGTVVWLLRKIPPVARFL